MSWYSVLDWLDLTWEAHRMRVLLSVGAVIAMFMVISAIAGVIRHYEELKR